jgi:hypothetical protein
MSDYQPAYFICFVPGENKQRFDRVPISRLSSGTGDLNEIWDNPFVLPIYHTYSYFHKKTQLEF